MCCALQGAASLNLKERLTMHNQSKITDSSSRTTQHTSNGWLTGFGTIEQAQHRLHHG